MNSFSNITVVHSPLEEVFAFFSDAANLEILTPAWLKFRILTPTPIAMQVGTHIDYRLRLRGFPMQWTSEITAWEPPHRFVDEQIKGPYKTWIHEHLFQSDGSNTIVSDNITYDVPGGRLAERLLVRPDIEKIFDYRNDQLAERFGG